MCGIAGVWEHKSSVDTAALKRMGEVLQHRGPDDGGVFIDESCGLGLAHRRLSIIDLSAGGHQPMERRDFVVTYNGEIYNFRDIRRELETRGVRFTSDSDTEVLIEAFVAWGDAAVHKFRGMFAFAIWNKRIQVLTLCRDRAGVKPLYYYSDGRRFAFASELKALCTHPSVRRELDADGLALFLAFGYIPSPHSIFKNISKLEPGHILTIGPGGIMEKKKYWDVADAARMGKEGEIQEEHLATQKTESILEEAFKLRMVSDVPVGVFLSGGIDSSLVTALLAKDATQALRTFTIGFEDDRYDEAKFAKKVARHLGTEHHELYLTAARAAEIASRLPDLFDEPFAAGSAIPTFFVSEFARGSVTVALSADGGDELFSGYGRKYPLSAEAFRRYAALPPVAGYIGKALKPLFSHSLRIQLLAARSNAAETYALLNKNVYSEAEIRRLTRGTTHARHLDVYRTQFEDFAGLDPMTQFQLFDVKTNLADNILTKVDRASMAVSLESREPFLDLRIMEHAFSLPDALKRKNGEDKYLLKQILYTYVPRELVDRPKHGFSMPLRDMLAKAPRDLVGEYLDESRIRREGILDAEAVQYEKSAFREGGGTPARLWRLLTFQMWKDRWLS